MSAVQNLINEVSQKVNALETAQALYSRQLSPNFNTFDYINTDELGLSRILAALLDPKGSHAQQGVFLKLFIEYCLPTIYKADKWQDFLNNIEKTIIILEEVTSKSNSIRRMDIYLKCHTDNESYGICIENKPYATDQPNQLIDYYNELELRHTNFQIVYLNEAEERPSKHSVDTNTLDGWITDNKYSHLRFSDLIVWLKACQIECQNHSVSEFLAQLAKFIQKQFMGIEDMSESNAILDIIKQNPETINASMKIFSSIEYMKRDLVEKLKKELLEKSERPEYQFNIENKNVNINYEKIVFGTIKDIGTICFEFQTKYSRPFLGVRFFSKAVRDSSVAAQYTNDINHLLNNNMIREVFKTSSWWPSYYKFQPYGWQNSSKPWQMIHTGEMADKILEEVNAIREVLVEGGYTIK